MSEKISKILVPLSIIIAGVLITGSVFYVNKTKIKTSQENTSSPEQVAQKAIDFINKNLLQQGTTASLAGVVEENGLYKFRLKIGENEYVSYVTKDGKILFPEEGINMEQTSATSTPQEEPQKLTCQDLEKSDKPVLEAFVVSQCPYGLQMQRVLNEIVKNIPSLANNIKVEYIGAIEGNKITSMHGDVEAQENLRQICLREEQSDKYWNYIDCYIKKGDVDGCLSAANIDKNKLNSCMSDDSRGLKYAKEDFDSQGEYGVSGSPTLFLNGDKVSEFDFGGRTAQAVKTLVCCGFGEVPDSCSQKLTEDSAATGFSETYSSASGSSSGGGCE